MKKLLPAVLAASLLSLSACVDDDMDAGIAPVPPTSAPELSLETMKDITRELSSDEFAGRAPGTVGEEKTLALLTERFAAAGIAPGNGDSWYQDVPLLSIEAQNVSPLTITGGGEDLSLAYGPEMVVTTYREQKKIDIVDSDMVFVGYGVNAPERGWNDYEGLDVKGKTVVILVNDPDFGTDSLEGDFGGRAMTYYGRWTYKYEEAARQGAAAALIVHDTAPASYGWNVVESSWSGPQFYAQSENGGADQTKVNGWIHKDVAARIFANAGLDLAAQMAAAKQKGFKAVDLGLKASVSFENTMMRMNSKNVIGILQGKSRPDEYVLYTAHWDHLGICKPDASGDNICNGAVDNATGTAALVALAEAHAKAGAPERSIIFLAVTAEESGLLGSKHYAENPVYPLAKTVGGVNMDAFLIAGPAKNVVVVGKGKSELDNYLEAALTNDGRIAEAEPTPEAGYYYRSDHFSFAKKGVPMIYFDGGEDLVDGGREAGKKIADDYRANKYHAPSDEFDADWDWTGVMADLRVYYTVARMLATTEDWPNWVEGDEFRAIRDQSRAGS
ncbi:Zn-dependent amino-or carboxypeptidase, M28 family [Parasphingorhabdus marina DSM 22363]|uniref:Zn-dependent amino-or carboxypeptidase, M28 family n=1 Tax=Parasphingorhabdus marina DSM 22363 TaxID=1123272 RepID=A0A1N6GBZ9_9SPHN|nr:M28 family metallopeptidase [Parasphingorhabdus marina]SIO05048.1 Zn-dependent amino-or carboxypeptidase, M28 family [Parasphingorhabdus marina DSM 22363]